MRFTREIPGIRPPLPGRAGRAGSSAELFAPGWTPALVWVFLHGVLGIYLFGTARFGGEMSEIWLETKVAGLSLWALATATNASLGLLLAGAFLASGWRTPRRDWKRAVGVALALGVLGLTQVYLNGWKDLAASDRERSQAAWDEQTESLRVLRDELQRLGSHPWAGEYASRSGENEVRQLLAPGGEGRRLYLDGRSASRASLSERLASCLSIPMDVAVQGDRLVLTRRGAGYGTHPPSDEVAVVEWGERRYLVDSASLAVFLARAAEGPAPEPALGEDVFLRLGDEARPLAGAPRVVALAR